MIYVEPGFYVTINQIAHQRAPQPLPLESGFSINHAYRVLGIYSPSETSEAFFILSNDRNEIWFISNRHLQAHRIIRQTDDFKIPLADNQLSGSNNGHLATAASMLANSVDELQ